MHGFRSRRTGPRWVSLCENHSGPGARWDVRCSWSEATSAVALPDRPAGAPAPRSPASSAHSQCHLALARPRHRGQLAPRRVPTQLRSGACRTFSTTLTRWAWSIHRRKARFGIRLPAALTTCRTASTTLPRHTRCTLPTGHGTARQGLPHSWCHFCLAIRAHRGPVEHRRVVSQRVV